MERKRQDYTLSSFFSGSDNREESLVSRSGCLSDKACSDLCQLCPYLLSPFCLVPIHPSSLFPGILNPSLLLSSGKPQPFLPASFIKFCFPLCYHLNWELLRDRNSFVQLSSALSKGPARSKCQVMYPRSYTEGGWALPELQD